MFNSRKLPLSAIIFIAVCSNTYRETVGQIALVEETESDVIDDIYEGCGEEAMKKFIHSDLLEQELKRSEGLQKAWKANTNCPSQTSKVDKNLIYALSVFHFGDVMFLQNLNNAVGTMGVNITTYERDFHYKSLHFLLMDSMKQLKTKECKPVYFISENESPKVGSKVRFSGFAKVHLSREDLPDLDGETLLSITSCSFVNLDDYICHKYSGGLISPAEVFTVEEIKQKSDETGYYTNIVLKHSALNGTHNCFMFPRSAAPVSTQAPFLLLAVLSLFTLTL
ncbi:unnamed protein product [Menidia menidia]|uniref:NAD(P)(+)--arginine ADP-ribosyltransferase n=1 Tax=Menidia menidia TaxID=238744 RepID=A0A8S4BB44_9TELE|nr:unnamed protein product [Menidia menidia]